MKRLLFLFVGLASIASASASTIRVRIYFIPWNVESPSAMQPEEVIKSPWIRTEIIEPKSANEFMLLLGLSLGKMKKGPGRVDDIRLVIKADQDDGTTNTYFASRFALKNKESGETWWIDDSFRKRYVFGYHEWGG